MKVICIRKTPWDAPKGIKTGKIYPFDAPKTDKNPPMDKDICTVLKLQDLGDGLYYLFEEYKEYYHSRFFRPIQDEFVEKIIKQVQPKQLQL